MAVVSVLLAVSLPAAPAGALEGTFANPAFCAPSKPLNDFGLSRLPPLRELPADGEPLPFAPKVNVSSGEDRVYNGSFPFGYGFSTRNPYGKERLDWNVTAQLWRISRGGHPLRQVGSAAVEISRLDGGERPYVSIDVPGRRGFYRYDIQFADRAGNQLGAYSAYVRMVRPFWRVRLGLDRGSYRPGERVLSRIENYGSTSVAYGEDFSVQRRVDGRWRRDRELTPDGFFLSLGILRPGLTGWCEDLRLSPSTEPGRYRILKPAGTPSDFEDSPRWLTAPFTVR